MTPPRPSRAAWTALGLALVAWSTLLVVDLIWRYRPALVGPHDPLIGKARRHRVEHSAAPVAGLPVTVLTQQPRHVPAAVIVQDLDSGGGHGIGLSTRGSTLTRTIARADYHFLGRDSFAVMADSRRCLD